MSINVQFSFDEDGGLDPLEPLGSIFITDGSSTISESCTFLDAWFLALVEGLRAMEQGEGCAIESPEEPDSLIFEKANGGVTISYKGTVVSASSLREFQCALTETSELFLAQVGGLDGAEENLTYLTIQKWLAKS